MLTVGLPPDAVPPTAFTTAQDIIGKTATNGPIVHGDMIRQEHLSTQGSLKAMLRHLHPKAGMLSDYLQDRAQLQGLKGDMCKSMVIPLLKKV